MADGPGSLDLHINPPSVYLDDRWVWTPLRGAANGTPKEAADVDALKAVEAAAAAGAAFRCHFGSTHTRLDHAVAAPRYAGDHEVRLPYSGNLATATDLRGRAMSTTAVSRPAPLVKLTQHPTRWLSNKAQLLVSAAALATIGMLIVVAVYYLAFEVNPTVTTLWHRTISDNVLRHDIRNVGEGLLGGLLAQLVVWDHFKRRRHMNKLDLFEIALHIPNLKSNRRLTVWQLLVTPVLVLIYAAPGFFLALGITDLIRHNIEFMHSAVNVLPALDTHQLQAPGAPLWSRIRALWTEDWDKKLLGYGASLVFGRRPAKKLFDDGQLWFAERRVRVGKPIRWYHTPTFKARYNFLDSGAVANGHRRLLGMQTVLIVGAMLAVFGGYVLIFIAGK